MWVVAIGTVGSMKSEILTGPSQQESAQPCSEAQRWPHDSSAQSLFLMLRHLQDKPASRASCSDRGQQGSAWFSPPLPGALRFSSWDAPFLPLEASCSPSFSSAEAISSRELPRLPSRAVCPPWHLRSHMLHYFMGIDLCCLKSEPWMLLH